MTYFNLENIYGPYCNPRNSYKPDAGLVRYAGTPWTGSCELNLESPGVPALRNTSVMHNLPSSTRFYIRVLKAPLCRSEYVDVYSEAGEKITIDCHTKEESEFYFETEKLKIIYDRSEKFPISPFAMVVTPLRYKTRMYSLCGFDCFTDTFCIDRSLICDRYLNCPNQSDENNCEYSHPPPSISTTGKAILLLVLLTIVIFDVTSILVCYFCCGINDQTEHNGKDGKRNCPPEVLEEGAAESLLVKSIIRVDNKETDDD